MQEGSRLVVETVEKIINNSYTIRDQDDLMKPNQTIKKAPKIFKEDCRINWNLGVEKIYNFIRGLSPYPASWTTISNKQKHHQVKIFQAEPDKKNPNLPAGAINTDGKTFLRVACNDGYISIKELQLSGKRRMQTDEFLKGFRDIKDYRFV
jgi:methionyl-tRNA formyltransferase